jgi:hypothetical protein
MHEWDVEDERDRDGERLSGALTRAVGGVEPDLGPLVIAAATQGRSLRRRRAGVTGAVAAALALTVGFGAVQLTGGGGQHGGGADGAAGGLVSSGPVTWNGKHALTGQSLLLAVADALPKGTQLTGERGTFSSSAVAGGNAPLLHTLVDATNEASADSDQNVAVGFDSTLAGYLAHPAVWSGGGLPQPDPDPGLECSNFPAQAVGMESSCTHSTLPDGSKLRVAAQRDPIFSTASVVYQRSDGAVVSVVTMRFSRHASSTSETMAAAPTLTTDQLTAVARSPEVQAWVTPDFAARAATAFPSFTSPTPGGTG